MHAIVLVSVVEGRGYSLFMVNGRCKYNEHSWDLRISASVSMRGMSKVRMIRIREKEQSGPVDKLERDG